MKLIVYRPDGPPIEIESDRINIVHGVDRFEIRPSDNTLLVRIEEHQGGLAMDLAIFPNGGNSMRIRGGR